VKCSKCEELLPEYVEGPLSSLEQGSVASHLQSCGACRAETEALTELRERLLRDAKALAGRCAVDAILDRIHCHEAAGPREGQRRRRLRLAPALAAGAAMAIVMVAVILSLWPASVPAYPAPEAYGGVHVVGGGQPQRGAVLDTADEGGLVRLGGYCNIEVAPNSRIELGGEEHAEEIILHEGEATCDVERNVGSFTVRTAVGSVSVVGTRFTVRLVEEIGGDEAMLTGTGKAALALAVAVMVGQVSVTYDGTTHLLSAGQAYVFAAEEKPVAGAPPPGAPAPGGGVTWGEPAAGQAAPGRGPGAGQELMQRLQQVAGQVAMVPVRPFDILQRLFNLTADQQKKLGDTRQDWMQERQKAIEAADAQLDVKYFALLSDMLEGDQKAKFAQVRDAIATYEARVQAAEAVFRETWELTTGEKMRSIPYDQLNLLTLLPGLTDPQRQDIGRSMRDLYRNIAQAVQKAEADAGITRPQRGATPQDWADYSKKRAEINGPISQKQQADLVQQLVAGLTEAQAKMQPTLSAALDVYKTERDAALEALKQQLTKIVGPEKVNNLLNPVMQFMGAGGLGQGGMGNAPGQGQGGMRNAPGQGQGGMRNAPGQGQAQPGTGARNQRRQRNNANAPQ
jgi:ferric-dicitrate binding protein FerR (iron transport regulator)